MMEANQTPQQESQKNTNPIRNPMTQQLVRVQGNGIEESSAV
jgi:hypothetical protein